MSDPNSPFIIHNSFSFWFCRTAAELQDKHNKLFKAHDISWPQWLVLYSIHSQSAKTPAEVADQVGVDRSAVTRLLDRLEKKQLINREHDKLDRRSIKLALTVSGKRLMPDLIKLAKECEEEVFKGVPSTERRAFKNNLKKVMQALEIENISKWIS
ncbi:MAG: MarR family transcriptional regulator [Cellvibrionaceae bacterium]